MGSEIIILLAVIAIVVLLSVIFSMWKKVPQDKAAVVTGLRKKVITGGGGLVIPVLERIDYISLGNIQLDVRTEESMSSQGVPIGVVGTAVIKVKNEQSCIFKAIEQFTGKNEQQIEASIRDTAMNVLEGKLREIVSTMTVEDIYRDRETFSSRVQEVVGTELTEMGLEVKVFTIKDINDRNGYIEALGVKQIADKKKDAEIAKAEAARETQIQTSKARQAGEAARLQAETEIAQAQKAKMVQEAMYRQENETAKAKADAAYEIQKNITQKEVTAAEMDAELLRQERQKDIEAAQVQIQIVKEQKEIELAQKRAEKTKEALRTTVVEPAIAEKERQNTEADAQKYRAVAEAEARAAAKKAEAQAEAEATSVKAVAQAEAVKTTGLAEAEAIRAKAIAEAEGIKARGLAEAEAMEKKAEAYKKYSNAAIAEMIVNILPSVASEIAKPLSTIDKVTVIDSGNGEGGVSSIGGYVPAVMAKTFETMKETTGIDFKDLVMADSYQAKVNKNVKVTGLDNLASVTVNAEAAKAEVKDEK